MVEAETLTEIFRDNPLLCGKVTESEVQHFIHCIEKGRNVKFLRFLQTIVQGGSRRGQEMVMNEVRLFVCLFVCLLFVCLFVCVFLFAACSMYVI